jgi:hypothetical protein
MDPSLIKGRQGAKWFLIRHSYVVCVDSPEEMNIYDVFLVDSSFQIQTKRNDFATRSLRILLELQKTLHLIHNTTV